MQQQNTSDEFRQVASISDGVYLIMVCIKLLFDSSSKSFINSDFLDDVDTVNYTRASRQSWRFGRNNNAGNGNVRRSSRQKKLVYGTFDQKILDKALYMNDIDEEPSRKRRRNEVELVDVEVSF